MNKDEIARHILAKPKELEGLTAQQIIDVFASPHLNTSDSARLVDILLPYVAKFQWSISPAFAYIKFDSIPDETKILLLSHPIIDHQAAFPNCLEWASKYLSSSRKKPVSRDPAKHNCQIFRYLTQIGHGNPADNNFVSISGSTKATGPIKGDLYVSPDAPGQYIVFTFPFPVTVTGYILELPKTNIPKSWVVHVFRRGEWVEGANVQNFKASKRQPVVNFPLQGQVRNCEFIKFTLTGPNASGNNIFSLSKIDFTGAFKQTQIDFNPKQPFTNGFVRRFDSYGISIGAKSNYDDFPCLFGTSPIFWESATTPCPFICFDFFNMKVRINGYILKAESYVAGGLPRSWAVEGSNDQLQWDHVDLQKDNRTLGVGGAPAVINLPEKYGDFRYIRITMVGNSSTGDSTLRLSGVELLGDLVL